jgi:AAA15 family ATPase/GTPase
MFVADSLRYEYQVAATRKQIWHESLRAFPEGKEQMWFRRDYSLQTEEYAWSSFNPAEFGLDTSIVKRTLPNVLFLSKAIAENSVKLRPVFNWFINTLRFHNFSSTGGEFLDEHFTSEKINQKSPISSQIKRLLQHADIGITDVKVVEKSSVSISIPDFVLNGKKEFKNFDKKPKREVKINLVPELLHQNEKGSAGFLPWENESEGTQHLFSLIGPWLEAFEKGHILCIDELENSLHPFLFQELLKLIFNTEVNPKHVQIIFTTHNPLLLDTDILRRDQIWFTEKNKNGEAHLYPLTNFAPRYTESLFRGYLSGRYGGIPFIPNGLIAERKQV